MRTQLLLFIFVTIRDGYLGNIKNSLPTRSKGSLSTRFRGSRARSLGPRFPIPLTSGVPTPTECEPCRVGAERSNIARSPSVHKPWRKSGLRVKCNWRTFRSSSQTPQANVNIVGPVVKNTKCHKAEKKKENNEVGKNEKKD